MSDGDTRAASSGEEPPWPQKLYDSVWLIAGAAVVFWALSYVLWGLIDILTLPGG
ncbi:MAG: hypothetical protein ABEJ46_03130 [Gemmatimonadota bacterium]